MYRDFGSTYGKMVSLECVHKTGTVTIKVRARGTIVGGKMRVTEDDVVVVAEWDLTDGGVDYTKTFSTAKTRSEVALEGKGDGTVGERLHIQTVDHTEKIFDFPA